MRGRRRFWGAIHGIAGYEGTSVNRQLGPTTVRVVPLGGLGEIGMNCLAIEARDGILVIDCGVSFPAVDLGVDVIHPDFTWLEQNAERVAGLFLTHGHEDHVGAVPYLLDILNVPVWGPSHSLGVARRRLNDHGFSPEECALHLAVPGELYEIGPFLVEPIRVSHSIVEASALAIETNAGTILHTGDFNFDPDPPDGEPTDLIRLERLGDRGVALMLSDSTNVDVAERQGSERGVGRALDVIVARAKRRVFVVLFASNIQRLIMLGDAAQRSGRRICVLGRSLVTQVEIAHELGRLRWPSDLRVSPEQARDMPPEHLLVLAGGSQAEPSSAMSRLAKGAHQYLTVEGGDTVVLSSRVIPGNERQVMEMICGLLRLGAEVISQSTHPEVHTSGHAGRTEQARMLDLIRPRAFVPVHGTLHHLRRHAELALGRGVPEVLVTENGAPILLDAAGLHRDAPVPAAPVYVAFGGERVHRDTLLKRAELGRSGLVAVSLALDRSARCVTEPKVSVHGVPVLDQDPAAVVAVVRAAAEAVAHSGRSSPDAETLGEVVRRAVRRRLFEVCGSRPVVDVTVLLV